MSWAGHFVGSSALLDSTGSLSRHRECQVEVSYEYDGAGRRVCTVDGVSGVMVEYAYVGDTLVAERLGTTTQQGDSTK